MNKEEEKALQASIDHWEKNVDRARRFVSIVTGSDHCACCQLQIKRQQCNEFECFHETGDCPIAAYTGKESCNGTPYECAVRHNDPWSEANWLQLLYAFLTDETCPPPEIWEIEDDEDHY